MIQALELFFLERFIVKIGSWARQTRQMRETEKRSNGTGRPLMGEQATSRNPSVLLRLWRADQHSPE